MVDRQLSALPAVVHIQPVYFGVLLFKVYIRLYSWSWSDVVSYDLKLQ